MAFEQLEMRAQSGKRGMPASMSLSCHGGSSRPAAIVALSGALVGEAGFTAKSRFNVLIGTEDDKGRLRIVADKAGIVAPRILKGGAFFLNLGYVPPIGVEPAKKRPTEARVIAPGTVEVMIPDFDVNEDEATRRPRLLPAPEPKQPAAAPGGGKRKSAEGAVTFNGVTIDTAHDSESVSFKGKSTEVTTRQARLVQLLARPRPAPVAESFLIAALWDGKPPQTAADQLRTMAGDLRAGLAPIGLNLNLVKGAGYQLKDR